MDTRIRREVEDEPQQGRWQAYGLAVAGVALVFLVRMFLFPGPVHGLDLILLAPALVAVFFVAMAFAGAGVPGIRTSVRIDTLFPPKHTID